MDKEILIYTALALLGNLLLYRIGFSNGYNRAEYKWRCSFVKLKQETEILRAELIRKIRKLEYRTPKRPTGERKTHGN